MAMRRGGMAQQIIGIQRKKNEPGRSAEGAEVPRLILPASAVSEQETCEELAKNSFVLGLGVFVATEKFVALDRGDHANGAFVAGLGALDAAEATHAYWASQSDFVRQGQENLDGRAFPYVLGKKEVNTARADVAGFGAGLANRGAGGPADGERQPHLEALSCAAFGTGQGSPPDGKESVSGRGPGNNRTAGTKSIEYWKVPMY